MRPIFAALAAIAAFATAAFADDPYTVRDVPIDATAANTYEAQAAAMRQGQRAAAERLFRRLLLPEDLLISPLLDELDDSMAAGLISGISVSDEQRSATRYLARLEVGFDPRAVDRLLTLYELDYVDAQARPALVLPVIESNGDYRLWDSNPWLAAWRDSDFSTSLTPFLAPANNSARGLISARGALSLDEESLRALAAQYGVNRIAVLRARAQTGLRPAPAGEDEAAGEARPSVSEVLFDGYIVAFDRGPEMDVVRCCEGGYALGFRQAARAFMDEQETNWKRDNIVRGGDMREMQLTVLYGGLGEWRSLQEILSGASLVESARLDAMSRDGALMTITFRGEDEQLSNQLAERGAALEEHPGLGWVVRSGR